MAKPNKKAKRKKTKPPKHHKNSLTDVIETVRRLRAPEGCPWDRAQTHQSIRQYLIEETYEVIDCLDQIQTPDALKQVSIRRSFQEELGDLLLQILLHSEMARQEKAFDIYDVAQGLNEKLIHRHPHVFGNQKADSAEAAFSRWEKQKVKEKAAKASGYASVLDGTPQGLPALQRAARVLEKVTKVGFQWNDLKGPLEKVQEELEELKQEVQDFEAQSHAPPEDPQRKLIQKKAEHEFGDLIFSLCNLAYLMKINPEDAFRTTLNRFESRFRHVEKRLHEQGRTPEQSTLEEMDRYWNEAKQNEQKSL